MSQSRVYRWAAVGDINAFFGLMLDNVTNLVVLATTLVLVFKMPSDVVYTRMFPGTALGVLFGDLVYTWMAFRLARREGRTDVTAMPLGLDAPSTIGMVFAVIGPAFVAAKAGMSDHDAAIQAWQVGMACMVLMGVFKIAMAFIGSTVQRLVPKAGLLGSIAGVGIALLGCLQLGDILAEPIVGMVALMLIFYTLVARIRLPFHVPGVLASVGLGAVAYYALGAAGLLLHPSVAPHLAFTIAAPVPTFGFVHGLRLAVTEYLPMAIPFALLTVVGGIDVTESARVAGDDYSTRSILLTEAFATVIAGVCGGVSQTTPYIGHPAYKAMGGRAAYTLATGIFVGLGGILGYIPFMAMVLPIACLAPILVFVGFDIVGQSFEACPRRHAWAVCLAMLPSLAQLLLIIMSDANSALGAVALNPQQVIQQTGIDPTFATEAGVFILLAHGFVLTGMLWGAALAFLIDRRIVAAAVSLLTAAGLALFGVIHSVLPSGGLVVPWSAQLAGSRVPWHWAGAYLLSALLLLALGRTRAFRESLDTKAAVAMEG